MIQGFTSTSAVGQLSKIVLQTQKVILVYLKKSGFCYLHLYGRIANV